MEITTLLSILDLIEENEKLKMENIQLSEEIEYLEQIIRNSKRNLYDID